MPADVTEGMGRSRLSTAFVAERPCVKGGHVEGMGRLEATHRVGVGGCADGGADFREGAVWDTQEMSVGGRCGGGGEGWVKSTRDDRAVGELQVIEGEDIKIRDGARGRTTVGGVGYHGEQCRV